MSQTITIEKSIPLPPSNRDRVVYPFGSLEVGDSFKVSLDDRTANSVRACASAYAKRHGITLSCRISGDHIRVWRTT